MRNMETEPLPVRSAVDQRMTEIGIPSYAELASEAGVDADTVTAVLDGRSTRPQRRTRLGLAAALYWDPDWLEYLQRGEEPPEVGVINLDEGSVTYRTGDDVRRVASEEVRRLEDYHRERLVFETVERNIRLMGATIEKLQSLGWHAVEGSGPDQPDVIAIDRDGDGDIGTLIIEVKAIHPGNETEAVSSALGKLMLYRARDIAEDQYGSRLVLVTDYPLDDQLTAQLSGLGVHHAWPGSWDDAFRPV